MNWAGCAHALRHWALAGGASTLTLAQAAVALPDELLDSVRGAEPLTLIVEIDSRAIDRSAAERRARLPRQIDNAAALEALAASYRARKGQVLRPLAQRNDIDAGPDFSHLPMLVRRVRSEAALRALAGLTGVRALHAERLHRPVLAQSLPLVGQPGASLAGLQGSGATVAVIDDGLALGNAAFGGCTAVGTPAGCRVVASATFVSQGATPAIMNDHGTNVAATVLGVAPLARVATVNVFDTSGTARTSDILSGINWAIANRTTFNIVAINMSLGDGSRNATPCTGGAYVTPVSNARNAGIHVVAAAGNAGFNSGAFLPGLASPACTPGVVSVGAVYDSALGGLIWSNGAPAQCTDNSTAADLVACFSMSASYLSLLAPGALITAGGILKGGTSQAAPHVAGALAVLRAGFATETLAAVQARLQSGGTPVDDARIGQTYPRLNLAASARPSNDDFEAAAVATGTSGSSAGDNRLATLQVGEPSHASGNGQSVWWQWTAPASGQVTLDTSTSGFDTGLNVYTGAALNALAPLASNDNASGGGQTSLLRFQAQNGTSYRWAVTGVAGATGAIALNWALNTAAQADLAVTLGGPGSVAAGATLVVNLALSNVGPQTGTAVVATLTLPVGLSAGNLPPVCSPTPAQITCTVADLAAGAAVVLALPLLNNGLAGSTTLTASVVGAVPDPVSGNNSAALGVSPLAGPGDAGDIPLLPPWALMVLGAWLLWRAPKVRRPLTA